MGGPELPHPRLIHIKFRVDLDVSYLHVIQAEHKCTLKIPKTVWTEWELNSRPLPCQGSDLPLIYRPLLPYNVDRDHIIGVLTLSPPYPSPARPESRESTVPGILPGARRRRRVPDAGDEETPASSAGAPRVSVIRRPAVHRPVLRRSASQRFTCGPSISTISIEKSITGAFAIALDAEA